MTGFKRGYSRKNMRKKQGTGTDYGAYLPTPEEIARGTAYIREGWTERDRESRCQLPSTQPAELQVIHVAQGGKALSGDHG